MELAVVTHGAPAIFVSEPAIPASRSGPARMPAAVQP